MSPPPRVTAIVAAFNEGDIIGQVIADLVRQGVSVYLLDHASTDDTVAQAAPFLGRGLLRIERFPEESGFPPEDAGRYAWAHILERKQALAAELDAEWFIHHDADEFRESPWPQLTLAEAIGEVDALGFNAIDFELFDFQPTHDRFQPGDDVKESFPCYAPASSLDAVQIRCWKKTAAPVDLVRTGGHEAEFEGRRVFPARFILRHYRIRSQAHGLRKVLVERVPRFAPEERDRLWHMQYEGVGEGFRFIRDPATLTRWDAAAVRRRLLAPRGAHEPVAG